ncbi:MAG: pyridoxamine 5'-phosphate oxidase family protein [Burkholderiaceae bacterium]
MSDLYTPQHRALHDEFDTRRMADLMEGGIVHDALAPHERAFIEKLDCFFLATTDVAGRPTVSYKGGDPGFVRVLDERTLLFPAYDGNGMFFSMGNLAAKPEVGFLFIDFETPDRLRVQGTATIERDPTLMALYPEAHFLVRTTITHIWLNCSRYVHKRVKVASSKYVPKAGSETPVPSWKRIDLVQDALPAKDQGKADALGGVITVDEYAAKIASGDA